MADLTAPQPGETITVTGTVLTSHTHSDNKFYGTGFAQLRVKLADGPERYAYADLRLILGDAGKWFGKRARTAAVDLAPEPTESMTKAELVAIAEARGIVVPPKATKKDVLGALISASSGRQS